VHHQRNGFGLVKLNLVQMIQKRDEIELVVGVDVDVDFEVFVAAVPLSRETLVIS
jgi:hypothetical protein